MRLPGQSRHEALPYTGATNFVPACRSVVEDGLADSRHLLLLASEERLSEYRDTSDEPGDELTFVATDVHGRNPARICALLESFGIGANGRDSLAITDWGTPGRSSAVDVETQVAESVLNSLADRNARLNVTCLYDADTVGESAMSSVRALHPYLRGEEENADFDPDLGSTLFSSVLPDAPETVDVREVGFGDLSAARRAVREFAAAGDLATDRIEDFVLAANEILTNSIRYGGGTGRMSLWEFEVSLICQVADTGEMSDPLAGRFAPLPGATNGRGLWLANQLCDLVQVRSSAAGTVVRLVVDRL